jgi:hypothetical protein
VRSRLVINIVLFIAVVVLALVVSGKLNDKTVEQDISLTDLDTTSVDTIRIIRKSSGEILFRKENGKWWMQEPYHMPANELRINTMLNLPGAHSYTRFRKEAVGLDRFLLNEPEVSIEFNDTRIDFGDTSPIADQRYVLVNDTIHLINDSLYQQLQTPATFFLSTRLLPESFDITAIHFPDYTIRNDGGKWTVGPDQETGADNIVRTVHAWRDAEAISLREYEDTESHGTIRIESVDGNALEYLVVNPAPQLILARPDIGLQYHISSYDAGSLFLETKQEENKLQDQAR